MQKLSYPAHEVYTQDRDLFLRTLFVPVEARESLVTVYALVVELEKIPGLVSEEMIGHIRYAWWQESIEALYTGNVTHGHPLLEALSPLIDSGQLPETVLMPMIEQYRSTYPEPLANRDEVIKTVSLALIPEAKGWARADEIIINHRKRYGPKCQGWLMLKLLLS